MKERQLSCDSKNLHTLCISQVIKRNFISSQSFWAQVMNTVTGEMFGMWQLPRFCIPAPRLALLSFVCSVCLGRDQMLPKLQGSNARKPKSQGTICSVVWREPHLPRISTLGMPSPGIPNKRQSAERCGVQRHFCMVGVCTGTWDVLCTCPGCGRNHLIPSARIFLPVEPSPNHIFL